MIKFLAFIGVIALSLTLLACLITWPGVFSGAVAGLCILAGAFYIYEPK